MDPTRSACTWGNQGPEKWRGWAEGRSAAQNRPSLGRPDPYPHPASSARPTPHDRVPAPDTHPHVLLRVPPSRDPKMTPTPKHRPNRPRAAGRSSGADRSVMPIWAATGWDGGADKRGPLADRLVAYGPRPHLAIPAPQTRATGHTLTPLHSSDLPPPPATPHITRGTPTCPQAACSPPWSRHRPHPIIPHFGPAPFRGLRLRITPPSRSCSPD